MKSKSDTSAQSAEPQETTAQQKQNGGTKLATDDGPHGKKLLLLSLSALGIVYGDIGTSPLYALRECFLGEHSLAASPANIMGVLSLVFWALLIVISIKYLIFVMRADLHGEGGILALMALAKGGQGKKTTQNRWLLLMLGLFGACLLYGDGMITPAISVLSAVEGLQIATPLFQPYVVPMTIAILTALFWIQHKGTGGIGTIFGPITLLWFIVIAVLGVSGIVREPAILGAVNPAYAFSFFARNGWMGFLVLGTVFLVVTGGETLYADMGHFGKRPIRLVWFILVLPALLLNYFGQGALLLHSPGMTQNPFFLLAPRWSLYPLVVLATAATVIASQAVITGAFSLTRQAIHLGYAPRMRIEHTSSEEIGQIYMPGVNWAQMVCTISLVLGFQSSSNLAAAYGVAVTTTMVITSLLAYVVARERWHWSRWQALPLILLFLVVDVGFFGANIIKVDQGGWFPLLIGLLVYAMMSTWKRGRAILEKRLRKGLYPLNHFLDDISQHPPQRVEGTAVFMTASGEGTPPALLHHIKHNKVLHKQVVLLTLLTEEVPRVPARERIHMEQYEHGFFRIIARYGFMESRNVPRLLKRCTKYGLSFNMADTSFYMGRETLIPFAKKRKDGMALWREKLFIILSRNSLNATAFFHIPPGRVVELGIQVEL